LGQCNAAATASFQLQTNERVHRVVSDSSLPV
jgi:hypothetical protein